MSEERMRQAANRLHHLSMRYGGAVVELATGDPVGFLPQGYPGLREMRDLVDLILLTRAEINGLTACLVASGHLDCEAYLEQMAEQYEWLAQQKAAFLGVEVSDVGIVIKRPT